MSSKVAVQTKGRDSRGPELDGGHLDHSGLAAAPMIVGAGGDALWPPTRCLTTVDSYTIEGLRLERRLPTVGPENVCGIEINPYAAELARATVWIGEIQWMKRKGFGISCRPILKPLDTIECRSALLTSMNRGLMARRRRADQERPSPADGVECGYDDGALPVGSG